MPEDLDALLSSDNGEEDNPIEFDLSGLLQDDESDDGQHAARANIKPHHRLALPLKEFHRLNF